MRQQQSAATHAAAAPHAHASASQGRLLQRKCACGKNTAGGGDCGECGRKRASGHAPVNGPRGAGEVPSTVRDALRSPGERLDASTRSFMESRFGHDFSQVRLHSDERAAESARALDARAYTVGSDIVFANSDAARDRHTLAHELTHVVQQNGMRGGIATSGRVSDPSDAAELEADRVASAIDGSRGMPRVAAHGAGIQREPQKKGPAGSFAVKMTPFITGLTGTIEFTPDAKNAPKCKSIRLVQVVRISEKPGQDFTWTGAEANREQVKTKEDKQKSIKPNFYVDHKASSCSKGKKCSVYYRDHWARASQDGSNDGVSPTVASLEDEPFGDREDVFEAETCARCAGTGAYLRCVDWGFTADSLGNATASATSEHDAPSATFTSAVGAFDKFYKN